MKEEKKIERFEEKIKTFKAGQRMKGQSDDVYQYDVTDDDGTIYSCIFRTPTRDEMRILFQLFSKDIIQANEHLTKICWLDGDEIIRSNDKFFMALNVKLQELLKYKEGELVKK